MKKVIFVFVLFFLLWPNSKVSGGIHESLKIRIATKHLLKCQYSKAKQSLENPTTAKEKGLYACIIGNDSTKLRKFCFTSFDCNKANVLVQESLTELKGVADSDSMSARILGSLYYFGIGVKKDITKAVQYYSQAAKQKEPVSMGNLGFFYWNGIGTDVNQEEGRKWLLRAAGRGNTVAMCELGNIYRQKGNFSKAEHYYSKAAKLGNREAVFMVAVSRINRSGKLSQHKTVQNRINKNIEPSRICHENAKFIKLAKQAAQSGYVPAMLFLAQYFKEKPTKSFFWYKKAAQSGLAKPLLCLAVYYEIGLGVNEDKGLSDRYCKKAYAAAKKQNNTNVLEAIEEFRNIDKEREREDVVDCQGTGFLFSKSGYVATNYHIVKNRTDITVSFPKNDLEFSAQILLKDSNNDLVILELKDFDYKTLYGSSIPYTLEHSRNITPGEKVFTLGYPMGSVLGTSVKLSTGIISSISGIQDNASMFQISNPIQPGNSGGPLFDQKGDVIGIVVSSLNAAAFFLYTGNIPQNVNFAVKSDYLINLVSMLPDGEGILARKNQLSGQEVKKQASVLIPYIVSISAKKNSEN